MSLLLMTAIIASAAGQPAAVSAPVSTTELVRADNRFGLDVYKLLLAVRPQENIFISPLSIALALQMTAHGAAGRTLSAMEGALGVGAIGRPAVAAGNLALREELVNADKKVRLEIANSLWLRKGTKLQQQFVDECGKYYQAAVTALDFARPDAVTTINNWVSEHTGDKIKQVVSQLTPEDILVLVNAVYFKGSWTTQFDPKLTAPREFRLALGTAVQRNMMRREGEFRYKSTEEMQAVALPYGSGRMSMYLFLSKADDGLDGLVDRVEPENVSSMFDWFVEMKGEVVLPRFKLEFEHSLSKILRLLGMDPAFGPGADFSDMVAPPATAAISDVLHKTFVEVNEEGTEAAAVTAVKMMATAMPREVEKFSFVCDHPFLCVIRDDVTGSVLFLGAIYDPKQ
jgi:serine protease inhibitor